MPWDLAESQRIAGKCWPKVGGFFANQASTVKIGPMRKASMVGFTLLSRSYYYLRRRSPGPPFPPDHRQAGERGAKTSSALSFGAKGKPYDYDAPYIYKNIIIYVENRAYYTYTLSVSHLARPRAAKFVTLGCDLADAVLL